MVQAKHKKPVKPRRHDAAKKHYKQTDITQFRSQLDALGLKIIQVTSDGNCFFRALADQLEGSEEEHKKYRVIVVDYIEKHREEFEPFIEDEVPFDEYCNSMKEDGTWAGNMELQAASLVTRSNVCIHRPMSPRWYIRNFQYDARMIHLSYHDGEHYNSIRLKEDPCGGPARPIIIQMDADISKAFHQTKAVGNQSRATSRENNTDMRSVKLVMSGTGCENYSKAKQVLKEVDGDVDAAIEYLIAERGTSEDANINDEICGEDPGNESYQEINAGSQNLAYKPDIPLSNSKAIDDLNVQHNDKKILKDKKHPQGSKKKQKMNGLAKGKPSTKYPVSDKLNVNKKKKERSNKKGDVPGGHSARESGELPDLGALCI